MAHDAARGHERYPYPRDIWRMREGRKLRHLPGLQSLRALAALMVLIGHTRSEVEHYFAIDLPGADLPWTRGVDIFFVISGFIVTLSAARFRARPAAFISRRLLRVAPLYILFTTAMVLLLIVTPGALKDTALDGLQILHSYLFLPYERPDGRIAPVLSLGWTLNYEVFFYVLLAFCIVLPRPLLTCSAVLLTFVLLGPALPNTTATVFYTNSLILEFIFGIVLARLWQRNYAHPSIWLALTALMVGLVLLILLHQTQLPRFFAAGLPAAIIVTAGTLFAPTRNLPMQPWGDASYALYLSHGFTLRAATLCILPLLPATPLAALVYGVALTLACLWVSLLVHTYIERPLLAVTGRAWRAEKALP